MGCGGSKATVKVAPLISSDESKLKSKHENEAILNGDSIHNGDNLSNGTSNNNSTKPDVLHETVQTKGRTVTNENKDFERNVRNEKRKTLQDTSQHDDNENEVPQAVSKGIAFDVALSEYNNTEKLAAPKRRPPHKLQKLESAPKLTAEMLAQKIAAAEENRQKIEHKLVAYEKNRSKAQAAIVANQQRREDRAKRVRKKAQ